MDKNEFKGGDILANKDGDAYLLLNYKLDDTKYGVIPYADVHILFQDPRRIEPISGYFRLLAGDFKRMDRVTYKQAERRNAVIQVLYGPKA